MTNSNQADLGYGVKLGENPLESLSGASIERYSFLNSNSWADFYLKGEE